MCVWCICMGMHHCTCVEVSGNLWAVSSLLQELNLGLGAYFTWWQESIPIDLFFCSPNFVLLYIKNHALYLCNNKTYILNNSMIKWCHTIADIRRKGGLFTLQTPTAPNIKSIFLNGSMPQMHGLSNYYWSMKSNRISFFKNNQNNNSTASHVFVNVYLAFHLKYPRDPSRSRSHGWRLRYQSEATPQRATPTLPLSGALRSWVSANCFDLKPSHIASMSMLIDLKKWTKISKELIESGLQRTKSPSFLPLGFSSGPCILKQQLHLVTSSVFSLKHVSGSFKNSLDQKHRLQKK